MTKVGQVSSPQHLLTGSAMTGGLSWVVLLLVALTAGLFAPPSAHAISLKATRLATDASKSRTSPAYEIGLTGPFNPGDTEQLATMLEELRQKGGHGPDQPIAVVAFDSRGGALEEGMRMGRLLRKWKIGAVVHAGKQCLSACALAFLGGTKPGLMGPESDRWLEIGGRLGFHAFYAGRDPEARDAATSRARGVTEGRAASALFIAYVMEMGANPDHLMGALLRAPDEMMFIETGGEFASLSICPLNLPAPRASMIERAAHVCNNASSGLLPAWPSLAVEYTPMEARRMLLAKIASDAEQAHVRAGIATRLQQVLRGGRGTEAIYDELAAVGLPLPPMRTKAFNLDVPDVRLSCLVTLSPEAPADFGVVLITPAAIIAPRLAPPPACPGLFLFGHDEIINPVSQGLNDRK